MTAAAATKISSSTGSDKPANENTLSGSDR
jgi:hypothetical protein